MLTYAKVPNLSYLPGTLDANDIAVWYALCSYARWECGPKGEPIRSVPGSCFPTVRAIAGRAGCSERRVQMSLRLLEVLGHVRTEARHAENGGQRSNGYTLYAEPEPGGGEER